MTERFIINARVEFRPASNTLVSLSSKENFTQLNAPTSRCLALLIERRYSVVPQNDFYEYVWGAEGVNVSINTLYQNLSLLRRALRTVDEGWEKMVVTVPKQGFKLSEAFSIVIVQNEEGSPPETKYNLPEQCQREESIPRLPQEDIPVPVDVSGIDTHSNKNTHFLSSRADTVLMRLVVALSVVAVILVYSFGIENPKKSYFSDFIAQGQEEGCLFYTRPTIVDWALKKDLIKSLKLDCKIKPYLYVTSYNVNAQLSFFACNQMMGSDKTPKCTFYYILKEQLR